MRGPTVTIVFLVYNRRDELRESLRRMLTESDYDPELVDVIVVDNASSDGSADMVREEFPEARVIVQERNIGAPAWNDGFAVARGDWVLVLDDDCYLPPDGLSRALAAAAEHQADFVSFKVASTVDPSWIFSDNYRTGLFAFWGCAWLIRTPVVQELGGYDPEIFIWGNELELMLRFFDRGYRHLHLPEVEAVHMKGPETEFHDLQTRLNARHFAYVAAKHLRARDAAGAVVNVTGHMLLQIAAVDRRALRTLPEIARGVAMGLRVRRPVRPEVSRVYRRNFWHYTSPLTTLRTPRERLRGGDADESRALRTERWRDARRELYPRGTGVLSL